jgi:hypothetical protein
VASGSLTAAPDKAAHDLAFRRASLVVRIDRQDDSGHEEVQTGRLVQTRDGRVLVSPHSFGRVASLSARGGQAFLPVVQALKVGEGDLSVARTLNARNNHSILARRSNG